MGRCQLRKLKGLVERRVKNAEYLSKGIGDLGGIAAPSVRHGCTHDYYVQAFKYDEAATGVPRNKFIAAVKAELPVTEGRETEGVQVETGYAKPLYLQPMFQKLVAYGDKGCPFKCPWYAGKTDYRKGLCPTAERLYEKELFLVDLSQPQMGKADLDDVISAFRKVYEARKELE
jgi:dTDP-4-amino-4,6-dideoxygalactose transaminase